MTISEQLKKSKRYKELLSEIYPDIINDLELIKLAQEAGITIDREQKNMMNKIVKMYLSKSSTLIKNELYYTKEFQDFELDSDELED